MAKKSKATPVTETQMTLAQVIVESGLSAVYVRRAITTGKLVARKEPVKEGSKTVRNIIERADYETWRATIGQGRGRADGRNKYVLYADVSEYARLMELVAGEDFVSTIKRANQPKPEVEAEATE
jgi:hypothetical protein